MVSKSEMMMVNRYKPDLTVTLEEFNFLNSISGFQDGDFVIGNLYVNHIDVMEGTNQYEMAENLLSRNLIKSGGLTTKTQLKRMKVPLDQFGKWHAYYIGGGTYGRSAVHKYYQENIKVNAPVV